MITSINEYKKYLQTSITEDFEDYDDNGESFIKLCGSVLVSSFNNFITRTVTNNTDRITIVDSKVNDTSFDLPKLSQMFNLPEREIETLMFYHLVFDNNQYIITDDDMLLYDYNNNSVHYGYSVMDLLKEKNYNESLENLFSSRSQITPEQEGENIQNIKEAISHVLENNTNTYKLNNSEIQQVPELG